MQGIHSIVTFWLFSVTNVKVVKIVASFLTYSSLVWNIDANSDFSCYSCSR